MYTEFFFFFLLPFPTLTGWLSREDGSLRGQLCVRFRCWSWHMVPCLHLTPVHPGLREEMVQVNIYSCLNTFILLEELKSSKAGPLKSYKQIHKERKDTRPARWLSGDRFFLPNLKTCVLSPGPHSGRREWTPKSVSSDPSPIQCGMCTPLHTLIK